MQAGRQRATLRATLRATQRGASQRHTGCVGKLINADKFVVAKLFDFAALGDKYEISKQ
jgi:hypothetical protein